MGNPGENMKRRHLIILACLLISASLCFGQQVGPAVIVNATDPYSGKMCQAIQNQGPRIIQVLWRQFKDGKMFFQLSQQINPGECVYAVPNANIIIVDLSYPYPNR
jgi:hypothetical protein